MTTATEHASRVVDRMIGAALARGREISSHAGEHYAGAFGILSVQLETALRLLARAREHTPDGTWVAEKIDDMMKEQDA